VGSAARELEKIVHGRADLGNLRLGRSAAAHRDDHEIVLLRQQPRRIAGDSSLPHALARADHGQRGRLEGLELRRAEGEVGAFVGDAAGKDPACEPETLPRSEHRLVGEVDGDLGLEARKCLLELVDDGNAVVVVAAELLGPADE
jgi:hypothetical protein